LSIRERRERQKTATRDGILAAAHEIARAEGWGAVTIRRIADAIEYSAPVIYEHFASKDAVLSALQRTGFEQLVAALGQTGEEPDRLLQMAHAYWKFAERSPELDRLMHGWESASLPLEDTLTGARKAAAVVYEALDAWAEEKNVTLADPQGMVETIWAVLHGLATIGRMDRLGGGPERGEQLAVQAVEDLLFAWAAKKEAV